MLSAAQLSDSFDANRAETSAFDPCPHLIQQFSEIYYFRFARCVVQYGDAICQRRSHHQILGASDGDFVEINVSSVEPLCAGDNVTVLDCHGRTELLKSHQVKIDWALPNGAAARQ